MTTALDNVKNALGLWNRVHPGESLDQQCERISGYYWSWAYQGNETGIITYPSAEAAREHTTIMSGDINAAPVGSFIYWDAAPYGHVGNVIGHDNGRAIVAYATTHGDTIENLGNGVKLSHADTYPHTPYGWSYTNGANKATPGLTDYLTPVPAPTPPPVVTPPVVTPPVVTPPVVTPPVVTPPVVTPPVVPAKPTITKAQLDADVAALKADSVSLSAGLPAAPLAGLLADHVKARLTAYTIFASACLLISLGPDLVTYSIITGAAVEPFTAWVSFASSALLKIGAAFGLIAASNTK